MAGWQWPHCEAVSKLAFAKIVCAEGPSGPSDWPKHGAKGKASPKKLIALIANLLHAGKEHLPCPHIWAYFWDGLFHIVRIFLKGAVP